ncbi:acyl-CoA thioesterase [Aquisediminimonas profunda]|uniref:acyl-CoA thioesterase n=1 Tax=Aquisediminimonas profunda TaxID=1550733 RepID=UPI001C6253F3|nr:acyl-CoA thioesterase II [Aquisediminimonas profunda]
MMNSEEAGPSPQALVDGLTRLLTVVPQGNDIFVGKRQKGGVGRVFGGEVIAQALMAATAAVDPDRLAHSLHAYFLRGGSEESDITYRVERDFDGGSFSARRVIAEQDGRPILNLAASFHKLESGVSHQDAMPEVPPPDDLPSEADLRRAVIDQIPERLRRLMTRPRAIEFRPVEARHWMNSEKRPALTHSWFRTVATLPDDPVLHRAVLAYVSDMTLLGTCALPHGLSWLKGELQSASLDHALWLHDDFRCDEWMLYVTESPWAGRARGFNQGSIYTRDGRLVANVAQEGLIRKVTPKP